MAARVGKILRECERERQRAHAEQLQNAIHHILPAGSQIVAVHAHELEHEASRDLRLVVSPKRVYGGVGRLGDRVATADAQRAVAHGAAGAATRLLGGGQAGRRHVEGAHQRAELAEVNNQLKCKISFYRDY